VDAQVNYTDRYAPPALETYDRDGEVVNRIVANPWYDGSIASCTGAASSACRMPSKRRTC